MSEQWDDHALAHIRWPKDWERVLTMPCIMFMQLPYVNNQYNAVFIAFGLKQKPLGGVEFAQSHVQHQWQVERLELEMDYVAGQPGVV